MTIRPTEHQMNEYFARIEKEMKNLTGEGKKKHASKEEREKREELHIMKCPKCGMDLIEIDSKA
ncbi:MAG: hypothetical protein KKH02_03815 [Proteobacteria bacterium]|nr:hypothetical protein [Pseudomonadota bacterium]MBU4581531.1 hypothetical protein [Pseudomonadota bacterium]MCG2740209.1 hypothetical protein [Syntrophaceae bacterium]